MLSIKDSSNLLISVSKNYSIESEWFYFTNKYFVLLYNKEFLSTVDILIHVIVVHTKQDTKLNCAIHISMVCVLNTKNALNNSIKAETLKYCANIISKIT